MISKTQKPQVSGSLVRIQHRSFKNLNSKKAKMRLWSLHPCLLDPKGLVALWREGLLAKNVLMGNTKGYKHHPQLDRFRLMSDPIAAIDLYLSHVLSESKLRGYSFDCSKLEPRTIQFNMEVTTGQISYEIEHLRNKLKDRNPAFLQNWKLMNPLNPFFQLVIGDIAYWEKTN